MLAFPQIKKRFSFSLFGSPPKSSLTNNTSLTTTQEIREDDNNKKSDYTHKSIDNLEKLVLASNEYRDCMNQLSKISKNFSNCLKEYCNSKETDDFHVQCLQFTAQFYENHAEVQTKLNKVLQKEFDTLQKFWDKYSKKVIKDEKAHNDYIGDLDKQIKKISKDYEKKCKKENKIAVELYDKYMASLTPIDSDIARARTEYAEVVMKREKHTYSVISQIICRLAENQFASFNDSLKKCGPSITKVKEWAPFAGKDIPSPLNFDSFLEMQSNSNNNELITSGKLSRTPSYKISSTIASISEMQKASMNNKSKETAPPLTKPYLVKDKPLTPNLLSSLSIGIHDDDNPFFRDASNEEIASLDMITETNESEGAKPIKTMTKINNNQESLTDENHMVSLTPSPIDDELRDITDNSNPTSIKNTFRVPFIENDRENNENGVSKPIDNEYQVMNDKNYYKEIRPAPSFETEWLVRSFPIDLPVRSIPQTPSNSPGQKSGSHNDREILRSESFRYESYDGDKRNATNGEFDNNRPIHGDKSDYPVISLQNDHRDLPLYYSSKSYRDRSTPRQYDIQPRRANTEYPLPDNKHEPSVARLLLLNASERNLSPPARDFPKQTQGYVNEVKSKFGGTNNLKSNNNTPDDMYPEIEHLEAFPSKSTINECDCHNCQEIKSYKNE